MKPSRWQQIDELLDRAIELRVEERQGFLDSACEGDDDLKREVESLLKALDKSGTFIDKPPASKIGEIFSEMPGSSGHGSIIGNKLGNYQVVSLIGSGGMGEVYLAKDLILDRNVAIKILPQHLSSNPEALFRFEREAKAVAALSHQNILSIHNFGSQDGLAYAVMEFLEGETLRSRISRAPLAWRESLKIGAAVADGLSAAHSKGIIHRDIKPENIFLTSDGNLKILDFGIARVKTPVSSQAETLITEHGGTLPGTLMGTIGYMSPEQVRGETADAPSDIFSLGCVISEMVTGKRPFTGRTAPEVMASILRDQPESLTATLSDIPPQFAVIVERCLEKAPDDRYQSARDLSHDLRSLITLNPLSSSSININNRRFPPEGRISRHRLAIAISLLLMAIIAAGSAWWILRDRAPMNSVAVLPFTNESGDDSLQYLSDGLPESLIESLSLLPQLRVMGWSTVRYKTRDQKTTDPISVGRDLKVHAVILGRVARNADSFTITVEMIDAKDGSHLWGEKYLLNPADKSNVQSVIAARISDNLSIKLNGEQQKQLASRYSPDTEAYQLYLQGRYFLNQRTGVNRDESLKKAISFFDKAIEKDTKFALAYAGIADANALLTDSDKSPYTAAAKQYANQAIALDRSLAEPHATLAHLAYTLEWRWADAEAGFQRAISLNPNYATAHHWYAEFLICQSRFDEALNQLKTAYQIEPLSKPINNDWGTYLFFARRYDEAIAQLRNTLSLFPDSTASMRWISNSYEQTRNYPAMIDEYLRMIGMEKASQEVIIGYENAFKTGGIDGFRRKRLENLNNNMKKGVDVAPMSFAYYHAPLGEIDKAIGWLEKGYDKKHYAMVYLKVDPRYDSLRKDPRFNDLVRRIGL
ncbi:MAG: protein kinase [Acidobacteria bacterium]|nr:protein kinase [Acidobacteriota bacterium]